MSYSCMIDLETKDGESTAQLVSIGACLFHLDRVETLGYLFKRSFYVNVGKYPEEYADKFTVSKSTLEWWEHQPHEVWQALEGNKKEPWIAITDFLQWLGPLQVAYGLLDVWGNAPQFDLSILKHHFNVMKLNCPWHYSKERDYRTMRCIAKMKGKFVPEEPRANVNIVKHNALHDAVVQANKLQQIYQHLVN